MSTSAYLNDSEIENLIDVERQVGPHEEEPESRPNMGEQQGVERPRGQHGPPRHRGVVLGPGAAAVAPGHGLERVRHQIRLLRLRYSRVNVRRAGGEEEEGGAPDKAG